MMLLNEPKNVAENTGRVMIHTFQPGPQCPPSKSDPNYSPLKKLKRLEKLKKIDFQHTTITLGLVNK